MNIKIVKRQKNQVINIHFPLPVCYNRIITSEGKSERFFRDRWIHRIIAASDYLLQQVEG